jgi:3-hydroxyisobutyrate dehydrogenase-like beta-hydroxyacid dehydrogenase
MITIGFIGLGTMGAPMAANLLRKGYAVTVYNRTPGKADQLLELGADEAATPAETVRTANAVITMISNDAAIEEVYYGEQGLLAGLKPGTTVIDSSTISPALARRIAGDVAARFGDFLDAPVTGSKPAAENGSLVFMVGGSRQVCQDNQDLLLAMGRDVIYMGPSGSGATAKLAHNTIVGINLAGLVEGMSIAAKAGIDANSFLHLVQSGGAASKQADLKGKKIIDRDFSVQFSLSLMLKDLRLSSVLSDGLNVSTPMLEASKSLFQMSDALGYGEEDLSALAQVYEQWIGRRIGGTPAAVVADGQEPAGDAGSAGDAPAAAVELTGRDRRRSMRLSLEIPLMMSIYQWEQEGSFTGQSIQGYLRDLSDNGLQIASTYPLAHDMFVVIHFLEESALPPMTARIIRIERHGEFFHYGCMLSALPIYQRLQLEEYIDSKMQ